MRVVLTQKMVVGHVMRYPGEVVDITEPQSKSQSSVEPQPKPKPQSGPKSRPRRKS